MIPDHALSKAIRAYDANTGFPAVFPLALEAAIETVAAEIWDQGYRAGFSDGPIICACGAWNDGECACGNYGNGETPEPNPYRASETA